MRNRFISLIFFLLGMLFFSSVVLDTLSMGQTSRVLTDFGLSFIELSGLLVILLLGGGMITREIEGRTIYLLLSKPIARSHILYGKFLGFSMVLTILIFFETICIVGLLLFFAGFPDTLFYIALGGIYLKLLSLLSLILLFSTFVSPIISLFLTISSYIIGHSGYVMLEHAMSSGSAYYIVFARVILGILPNFEALNLKNYVGTTAVIPGDIIGMSFLFAFGYIIIFLLLGAFFFKKRSFDNV